MSDLLTVALICASTLQAHHCSRSTALDVVVSPARTALDCALGGQAMVAGTGLASGEGVYLKISCERRHAAGSGNRPTAAAFE